ncbi:Uma2 family endonuclease, partial [Acidobacteria bacterium AH-259-L09]|nr:Uma2 family endonuclease [Acidobacteria bacterium AH-259-L09]
HNPVRLDQYFEPLPDIALLKPREDFYAEAHPGPPDILLIIEVAHASQEYDRKTKMPLYARFRVPEVWLVDVASETVDVYGEPAREGYQSVKTFGGGSSFSCESLPKLQFKVEAILGIQVTRERQ